MLHRKDRDRADAVTSCRLSTACVAQYTCICAMLVTATGQLAAAGQCQTTKSLGAVYTATGNTTKDFSRLASFAVHCL